MQIDYKIFIYIIFGIVPSLAWLSYYLRQDRHPEPKRMIVKIFLWGALITVPVFFVQIGLGVLLDRMTLPKIIVALIYWFVIIALSEEVFKYLVVRLKVVHSQYFDEPVDAMIYMVVAALGFAALENILYLFAPSEGMSLYQVIDRTVIISIVRFAGATFLHTLCSAVIGYALAISFYKTNERYLDFDSGLLLAVGLHGLYDFSIITLSGYLRLVIPLAILFILAILVLMGFAKLRKIKSVCDIDREKIKEFKTHPWQKKLVQKT